MYFVLEAHQTERYPSLMAQMFRLRARVFGGELGWVEVDGDEERDVYDDCCPAYIMHTDPTGNHLYAAARLMPTMGPTLLADVFGDTVPDAAFQSPFVWEITRLCVDDALIRAHGRGRERLDVLRSMLVAGMEYGVANGIDSFLANFDAVRQRMWERLGARFDVIGTSERFSTTVHLGLVESSPAALADLRRRLGRAEPVLAPPPAHGFVPGFDAAGMPCRALRARSRLERVAA